jgi:hypothetical protein
VLKGMTKGYLGLLTLNSVLSTRKGIIKEKRISVSSIKKVFEQRK